MTTTAPLSLETTNSRLPDLQRLQAFTTYIAGDVHYSDLSHLCPQSHDGQGGVHIDSVGGESRRVYEEEDDIEIQSGNH